ncbi:MAG: CRISPR-associated endoribonuclease Cas6 [Rhodothermaceae bacterium]|nr:MAG: CRISPR-associated endoribonuclease Cas6 [Rhodothermaceae bacterium]
MRIRLRLSPSTSSVPFNHVHRLLGVLHRWLGPDNPEHDGMSLYSMGWLQGGEVRGGALHFPRGATWTLGFYGYDPTRRLTEGILRDPEVFSGLRVLDMQVVPPPRFERRHTFRVASPVIARRHRADRSQEYLLWDDPRADAVLTRLLRTKMERAGLGPDHLDVAVAFDRTYPGARTKLTTIRGVQHKGSLCPVILTGTPEALTFAWTCGVGELTGSGFGALQ